MHPRPHPLQPFLFALLALAGSSALTAATPPQTLRVDYFHTGNAREERFALERVVIEPLPWPGDLAKTVDDTNLGKYLFEVIDRELARVLYSRGFASIYGEWETTGEASEIDRTFSESLRFPRPPLADGPVQVVLKKRDKKNDFREIWSLVVDPADMLVDTSRPPSAGDAHRAAARRRSRRQARLPDPGRRLHRRRAREVRARRPPADGDPLRGRAVQEPAERSQRLGPRARPPPSPASRDRRSASIAARRSARPTTPSAPSVTS